MRQADLEAAGAREEQDKEYILTVESNYQQQLHMFRQEKDLIADKAQEFAGALHQLTREYEHCQGQLQDLQRAS